jgi:ribose-phosphate pyrophosphokinase
MVATIAEGVLTLLEAGARPAITVAATHGLLLEGARSRLAHPAIHGLFVTDSVAVPSMRWPQLHVVTLAPLLVQAVRRLVADEVFDEQ